jgi:hypothetical protein
MGLLVPAPARAGNDAPYGYNSGALIQPELLLAIHLDSWNSALMSRISMYRWAA